MINPVETFVQSLIARGLADKKSLRGCSDSEIGELERNFGYPLPVVYKDFLRATGNGAGEYGRGTNWLYRDVFNLKDPLAALLKEGDVDFDLPDTAFVFSSHQGYIFNFFDVAESLYDPPVYGYREGDGAVRQIYKTFSGFLLSD